MQAIDIQADISGEDYAMQISGINVYEATNGYHDVEFITDLGSLHTRWYKVDNAKKAVIMVGGAGGGFDSPANNLYRRLSEILLKKDISSLRIQFRHSNDLAESVLDADPPLGPRQPVLQHRVPRGFGGAGDPHEYERKGGAL